MSCKSIIAIVLVFIVSSCVASRPVMQSTITNEREHNRDHQHAEVRVDSTIIDRLREVIERNDTVYIYDSIYIERWRDKQVIDSVHDTLYIEKVDSITNTITEYVEKPIAPFVRNSCIALWVMIGVAIIALVIWVVRKFATGNFSWIGLISKILR